MNRLLFITLLLFSCSLAYSQPNYLFIKKGLKKKKTYAEGDRILLQLKNGAVYSGLITHLINNSIYINGQPVNKDSVKEVIVSGRQKKMHIELKDLLLINAGVALTTIGLTLNNQATFREAAIAGVAIGYTPLLFAWLKNKIRFHRNKFKMGKKFRLQVFDLYVPNRRPF